MTLARIERVDGRAVHVPGADIDTDRITPARFLKCVTFDGLGESLFHDARFAPDGSKLDHPLDDPRFAAATVLLVDRNFGCGSSREHAPQAIARRGFRALIGESFAEIFFGNATAIGLPCVTLDRAHLDDLAGRVQGRPEMVVAIDLIGQSIRTEDGFRARLGIPEGARQALVAGQWDPIGELLEGLDGVRSLASEVPYPRWASVP
jgi:3-isopropylmalate/(R)-2-methylmalate dehydratase small subunit